MEYVLYINNLRNNLKAVDLTLSKNKKITRLYFGEEFCEKLIPSLSQVKTSLDYAKQKKIDYTYLTGYLFPKAFKKQSVILSYLNDFCLKRKIEVVVNDWGTLSLISKKFSNLTSIMGRMLTKNWRMPRFVNTPPVSYSQLVENPKVHQDQERVLRGHNLSVVSYRKLLKKYGIKRIDIDLLPQGIDLNKSWGFNFSFYTPWSYVTGGRHCDFEELMKQRKIKDINDKNCSEVCQKYYIKFETGPETTSIVQKGNSLFFKNSILVNELKKQSIFDRVIFENFLIT